MKLGKQLEELNAAIVKEQQWVSQEFDYLHQMEKILNYADIRLRQVPDDTRKAYEKAIRKQCLKLFKKAGRIERRVQKFAKRFMRQLEQFIEIAPTGYQGQLVAYKKQIEINTGILVRELSRESYLRKLVVAEGMFNSSVLLGTVVKIIQEGIQPLEGTLLNLEQYIKENRPQLQIMFDNKERAIEEKDTLTVDIDSVLREHGLPLDKVHVLIDTDFAKNLSIELARLRKNKYNIIISCPIFIPKIVLWEMKKVLNGTSLVPNKLIDYLISRCGAQISEVDATAAQKEQILTIWRTVTSDGRIETEQLREKFWYSGDMKLLIYGMWHRDKIVVVLSDNYDDIGKIAARLNELDLARIQVLGTQAVYAAAA
jgi:hypothetical protein